MDVPATGAQRGFWPGCAAVAATYAYFLLFAEFAFLKHVEGVAGNAALVPVMAALGAGGLAGSGMALWRFAPGKFLHRLRGSYAACAVAAAAAALARGPGTLQFAAAGIGLALGWNTVTLAAGLRLLAPERRLGLVAGIGTGAAYAFCNLPGVFLASPMEQIGISAGVAVLAAIALPWAAPGRTPSSLPRQDLGRQAGGSLGGGEDTPGGVRFWVMIFLALVAFDSAAFYLIQRTPAWRDETWHGVANLWAIAGVHLGAAGLAGRLLDRGKLRGTVVAAGVLLLAACLGLGFTRLPLLGITYAAGVSLYSAALVYFAARDGRPWVAALVFALAGWVGSAAGMALAQAWVASR
jgi:cytochrome c oxidase cbb3-type subunit 2